MPAEHGTRSRFVNDGCHCEACRGANAAYFRERRRAAGGGSPKRKRRQAASKPAASPAASKPCPAHRDSSKPPRPGRSAPTREVSPAPARVDPPRRQNGTTPRQEERPLAGQECAPEARPQPVKVAALWGATPAVVPAARRGRSATEYVPSWPERMAAYGRMLAARPAGSMIPAPPPARRFDEGLRLVLPEVAGGDQAERRLPGAGRPPAAARAGLGQIGGLPGRN
jgi:hypothetical protein